MRTRLSIPSVAEIPSWNARGTAVWSNSGIRGSKVWSPFEMLRVGPSADYRSSVRLGGDLRGSRSSPPQYAGSVPFDDRRSKSRPKGGGRREPRKSLRAGNSGSMRGRHDTFRVASEWERGQSPKLVQTATGFDSLRLCGGRFGDRGELKTRLFAQFDPAGLHHFRQYGLPAQARRLRNRDPHPTVHRAMRARDGGRERTILLQS